MFINLVAYYIVPTSFRHDNDADNNDDDNPNVEEVASETGGVEESRGPTTPARIPPGAMTKW